MPHPLDRRALLRIAAATPALALSHSSTVTAQTAPIRASNPLPGADRPLSEWPTIAPIAETERVALRPLLDQYVVILPRNIEDGINARITIYTLVRAPLHTVHRIIATPERYLDVVPALSSTDVLSRRGRRAAFRFHAVAAIFDLTANATMHVVSDRRIDIDITNSEVGPAGSRWELFPEENHTILALTVWCDPSRAGWIVRQFVNNSSYAASSADIIFASILALGVRRKAEQEAGSTEPLRPSPADTPPHELLPPPRSGPWLSLLEHTNVLLVRHDQQGRLTQVTAAGASAISRTEFTRRILSPDLWPALWPWIHTERPTQRTPVSTRFRASLDAPLSPARGEILAELEADSTVHLRGVSGDFLGEHTRWDHVSVPEQLHNYILYTGTSEAPHASWFHRLLISREPLAVSGISAYWKTVMLRYGLAFL